jgi:SAM-dependent methyltransferase
MAMTTTTVEPRARFYRQQSDPGSHLSPAYNQAVLHDLLSRIDKDRVRQIADLGSGSGSNLATLHDSFPVAQIVTLDINSNALAEGRGLAPNLMPVVSDAAAIPVSAASVDLVVCTEVLEHVADMEIVFREMGRILRPSGSAVISSPNYLNPMGVRKWWNDRRLGESFWDPWGGHPGFERLMLPSTVQRALHPYFEVRMVRGAGYLMGWIPLGYRRIGGANDRFPLRWIGRLPLVRSIAINRYLLLKRKT